MRASETSQTTAEPSFGPTAAASRPTPKTYLCRHVGGMLIPQLCIYPHQQRSSVLVAQPSAHGRNVHPGLDACGGEYIPQIVVGHPGGSRHLRGAVHGLLAFLHGHHPIAWLVFWTLGLQAFQEVHHRRDHWNDANLPCPSIL